jgi:hypothetical protein
MVRKSRFGRQRRQKSGAQHVTPGHIDDECRRHVDKKNPSQELQIACIAVIRHQDLGREANQPECHRIGERQSADHDTQNLAHSCEIGSNIDGVRDDQQYHEKQKHRSRKRSGDIGRKPRAW